MKQININRFKPQSIDINDPVAHAISWDKTQSDFSQGQIQKIYVTAEKITIKSEMKINLFFLLLFGGGIYAFFTFLYKLHTGEYVQSIFYAIVCLAVLPILILKFLGYKPFTINLVTGKYYFGRNEKSSAIDSVSNIHAIQLLEARTAMYERIFTSYELNLVLKNASRITIMVDPKLDHIFQSATKIAQVLKIPIWQAEYG
jgi:hypothetical protein